jgi:DNA-binding IclR family transcriptional regulator
MNKAQIMKQPSERSPEGRPSIGSATVDKAFDILEALASSPSGLTNSEVSAALELDRSTSYRLLSTLERRGYAARVGRRYTLGSSLYGLAWDATPDLQAVVRPILIDLQEATGETASFSLRSGASFYCVATAPGGHELTFSPTPGMLYPLNAGAAGMAIWAFLPDAEREALLLRGGFESFTGATLATREALSAELEETLERGYALSAGVRTPGGCSIACPCLSKHGAVVGALAVSAAEVRVPVTDLPRFRDALLSAKRRVEAALSGATD